MNDNDVKKLILIHLEELTGLKLSLCDYFTEIGSYKDQPYINILLGQRCWGEIYDIVENAIKSSKIITHITPNGVERVAVVYDPIALKKLEAGLMINVFFPNMHCKHCNEINPFSFFAPCIIDPNGKPEDNICICSKCVEEKGWLNVDGDLRSDIFL